MTQIRDDALSSRLMADFLDRSPWQNWTPTVTQSGGVTVTVTFARYIVLGDTVIMESRLDVTGTGTANNAIIISGVPAAIQPANPSGGAGHTIGIGNIQDTGSAQYIGALVATGANDWRIIAHAQNNYIGIAPNFALASGDIISFQATYER